MVVDRSHLASQIHARQSRYGACVALVHRSLEQSAAQLKAERAQRCGWSQLEALRTGELISLPFFALACLLSLILAFRVGRPRGDEPAIRMGDSSAEDAIL